MARLERTVLYGVLLICVAIITGASVIADRPAVRADEDVIATCDIYKVTDALLNSDRFQPDIESRQAEIGDQLRPMEEALRGMQEALQGMDQEDPELPARATEFRRAQQEYQQRRAQLEADFEAFVSSKYVEAYGLVRESAEAVAEKLGYSYVIASRVREEAIEAQGVQQVIQAVLARPMVASPEGTDITEDVAFDLKIELED